MENKLYLTGQTIKLNKFTNKYITADYISWLNDPEVNRYLDIGRVLVSSDDVFVPTGDKNMMFAIMHKESASYIGTCSLHKIDWISRKAEIGYMIGNKNYWGKGIASELIGLLTDYGIYRLGLNKITAGVVGGNDGSIKALLKNGYTQYGINPQDYFLDGELLDTYMFCKVKG